MINNKRRKLLTWVTPTIAAVALPAHAQTSDWQEIQPTPDPCPCFPHDGEQPQATTQGKPNASL